MITCFRAPSLGQQLRELPTRLLIAPWGKSESVKGPVVVNDTTVKALPRLQELTNFRRIDLDFNHNTVPGSEEFKAHPPPRKIAGKGTPEVVPGEGIYLNAIEWTPEGQEAVKNGHYDELSPAPKMNERGEILWLHSCAVVPHGAIEGLKVFSAEEPACLAGAIQTFSAESGLNLSTHFPTMNHKVLLCTLLGLAESATDEQIAEGVKTFSATLATLKTFSADFAALRKRLDDQERAAIKDAALRAGKIVPLTADELPIEQFRKLVSELPADQVPLDKRTPDGVKTFSSSGLADTAGATEVRAALGISEETWKKHA